MKRITAVLLALCAFAYTAYASETAYELILKWGFMPVSAINGRATENDAQIWSGNSNVSAGISLTSEFYIYPNNENIGLGLGISHAFQRPLENSIDKIGFTSLYAGLRPKLTTEDEVTLYLLGQIGLSIPHYHDPSAAMYGVSLSSSGGLYYAIGIGVEINSVIVEFLYTVNQANARYRGFYGGQPIRIDNNMTHKAIHLNIGYRFNFISRK